MLKKGGFYTVQDVMNILGVKQSKAYREIRKLNNELKADGYITIAGKVPAKKFNERFYQ
jgi:hypothetical protein